MIGGRIWGTLFFLFLTFAALTTVVAVFENIVSFGMDLWGWSRQKAVLVNMVLVTILILPCIFGFNIWSSIQPLGEGSTIMDLEDFLVSNNVLPLGSLVYILFCTQRHGWGWDNFIAEANTGKGLKFPKWLKGYMTYILPIIIVAIYLKGYYDLFSEEEPVILAFWMGLALFFLVIIGYFVLPRKKK